jgi:Fe-Mn family superoxide dismutase
MAFTLPPLPFDYDALSPHMSKETLEYHHDKHHRAYVTTANDLMKDSPLKDRSVEDVILQTHGKNAALFNNAAQHYNHTLFWHVMKPNGGGKVPGMLEKGLKEAFGSLENAKQELVKAGTTQFGSGWAWFAVKDGKILVLATANAENPLVQGATPILCVDVWEHSYYVDYRNRRPDYLKAFVENLINWETVAQAYDRALIGFSAAA